MATLFYFCGHPSRAGNRYDSLATPLESYKRSGQYIEMCLSSMLFHMLNLSVFILWFIYGILFCYIWIFVVPFLVWLWIRVSCLFAHTHANLHNINSLPELRPFRRKCWLCSHEIIISAMASQTLLEPMVLITSWGNNLCTVIRKCSHSNRTLSIWAYNGWGSRCLTSLLGTLVRNDLGTF